MLNLFTLNKKKNNYRLSKSVINKKISRHFPSPLREWKNSAYFFNKNSLNLIPCSTRSANNIIKSYFDLFNNRLEKKMRTKRLLLRFRRLSSNRLFISNGEFKHTNNKVLINLFIFNRQKNNYLLSLKNWYLKAFLINTRLSKRNLNIGLIKRLNLINKKGIKAIKQINEDKYLLIKTLNVLSKENYNINKFKNLSIYTENFYRNLLKKSLKKIKMYFYYRQLLYINRSKFNYNYLQYLKNTLEKIYNKNVEFNLVNIRRFYLNSDIMSKSITLKISKNRSLLNMFLNMLKNKIKIKKKKDFITTSSKFIEQNLYQQRQNFIINNLKYKYVTGFRLKAVGRLSKRFTASRSNSKIKYKGNLLDMDSSYKGLSSVLLKGNLKSNTQFTKLKSKTRTGSFGVKGWISGN